MSNRKHRDLPQHAKTAHSKRQMARRKYLRIISEEQGGLCLVCKCELRMDLIGISNELTGDVDARPTIEHMVDMEYGGTNDRENLSVVCYRCNQDKNDKKNRKRYNES